jgi:carbon-monoxide dehydrogenase medium subunit
MNIKGLELPLHPIIDKEQDALLIGALVCHRHIEKSAIVRERFRALQVLEENLASVQMRNHGTLVGNLCAAEPWTDAPCLMAAADARLLLVSQSGSRTLAVDDFVLGAARTSRHDNEIVVHLAMPLPGGREGLGHSRMTPRRGLSRPFACASARVSLGQAGEIMSARIFIGAMDERPQRMSRLEARLAGLPPDAVPVDDIDQMVESDAICIADDRCSLTYKKQIAGALVRRALNDAVSDAVSRGGA